MPKRLSVDARKLVLTSATEEARRRGDRRLGTDHLLLGLLHDGDSQAARALGVSLADARAASDALDRAALAAVGIQVKTLGEGPPAPSGRRLPPLTSGARAVFKLAIDEARPDGKATYRLGNLGKARREIIAVAREQPDALGIPSP